jgi:hypothetical protein
LQVAAFEIVTRDVAKVSIPERVFAGFGQAVTNRTFQFEDMLYANGRFEITGVTVRRFRT